MAQRKGGGNFIAFFAIESNAFATSEKTLNQIYKCTVTRRADLGFDVEIDQDEDTAALELFLEEYRVAESSGGTASKYENGGDPATGGSTDALVGGIIYGAGGYADVKTAHACFKVDPTSGSWSTEHDVESRPTVKLSSVAPSTAVTIAAAKFDATRVTIPAGPVTIPISGLGSLGRVVFLDAP